MKHVPSHLLIFTCLLATCGACNQAASRPEMQTSKPPEDRTEHSVGISETSNTSSQARPNDWSAFLGTDGTARSSEVVPLEWSETENLLWKMDLPGSGSSSPIIVGDRVIVTCYVTDDKKPKRQVLCFDKITGEKQWSVDFPIDYNEDPFSGYISEHGYSSNTPVSDGENVYVFFGKGGVHSISLDGTKGWSFDAGKGSSNRQWGSAASLVLYRDLVIVNAAEESKAIIALAKKTGAEIWRQDADLLELTFGTPRIVRLKNGDDELVISVPSEIWGMNPETGKLKWFATSPTAGNVSPSVIVDGESLYSFGGYRSSGSIAVTAGGSDDVTDSNVVWTNRSSSYVSTPLLHDSFFYWIDDKGIAFCTSTKDGEIVYRERVKTLNAGDKVYASPVLIGENIYVVTRRSGTIVYAPGDNYNPVSQNVFATDKTDFNASPAVSAGRLYLRSDKGLYCIAEQSE